MPELPEVRAAAKLLEKAATGKTVAAVKTFHPSLRRRLSPQRARAAVGQRITSVERQGKHQLLHLQKGDTIVIHFRMNGDWEIGTTKDPIHRHTRAAIELKDGTRISLVDRRALSSITIDREGESSLPKLGLDAASPKLSAAHLREVLAKRTIGIKPALMDQSILAGLGNIYAAEALWLAELSPKAKANKVTMAQLEQLVDAIKFVLNPKSKLATRYTDKGAAKHRLAVYDREGEVCRRCGKKIDRIVQAGRSTYYCPGCQKT
jgi:formamidopyrimidine-DNA glycosylase